MPGQVLDANLGLPREKRTKGHPHRETRAPNVTAQVLHLGRVGASWDLLGGANVPKRGGRSSEEPTVPGQVLSLTPLPSNAHPAEWWTKNPARIQGNHTPMNLTQRP